jgi:dihydroorotate dehydrogenase (NAD+) catalytic subunit
MPLQSKFLNLKLNSPTVLASGILDTTASSMRLALENGAGAVITKSISQEPRKGHPSPIILTRKEFIMNAVGLSNPGIEDALEEIKLLKSQVDEPVIASIFAKTVPDYGKIASLISDAKPDLIEVNISCPNIDGKPFSSECSSAAAVTGAVKAGTKIPISVKLSPNVSSIKEIAKAVEEAGADAITAVNTYGPGLAIDINTARPILGNKFGGVSGPGIKPLALKAVYDIYEEVEIPIMGAGGISSGKDAAEMLMAGAALTQIGSAVYYRGIDVFGKINKELSKFMNKQGYSKTEELVGKAHV